MEVSGDGRWVAVSCIVTDANDTGAGPEPVTTGDVRILRTDTLLEFNAPLRHAQVAWALAFSPDSQLLLTGCRDGFARFWEVSTHSLRGKPLVHKGNVVSVAFAHSGNWALTGDAGGHRVYARLWEIPPTIESSVANPKAPIADAFAVSPDGKLLLTAARHGGARLWNSSTHDQAGLMSDAGAVHEVRFAGDGRSFLALSSAGIRICDVATGAVKCWIPNGRETVTSAALDKTAEHLLTGDILGVLKWWQLSDLTYRRIAETSAEISAVAIRPDSSQFVAATKDRQLLIGDPGPNQTPKWELLTHAVTCLAFSSDGRLFATGSREGTVRIWDAATGKPRPTDLLHSGEVDSLDFNSDSSILATACQAQGVRLWDVAAARPLGPAVSPVGKCLVRFHPKHDAFAWLVLCHI